MASRKRGRDCEDVDISEMSTSMFANVHGLVVGDLSPIKCSRKRSDVEYFEGSLSDGKKVVRMVSFKPKLHNEFQKMRESGESVKVSNCCVQDSKQSDELEVVVGS